MTTIEVDWVNRHGHRVRASVARAPGIRRLGAMLSTARGGLRAIVGSDGVLYAWEAHAAIHVDVARALGFDAGEHMDLRLVAEGDDPFEPGEDWGLGPRDRVVGGVRVLPGSTPWSAAPLAALGFEAAEPCGSDRGERGGFDPEWERARRPRGRAWT